MRRLLTSLVPHLWHPWAGSRGLRCIDKAVKLTNKRLLIPTAAGATFAGNVLAPRGDHNLAWREDLIRLMEFALDAHPTMISLEPIQPKQRPALAAGFLLRLVYRHNIPIVPTVVFPDAERFPMPLSGAFLSGHSPASFRIPPGKISNDHFPLAF